MTATIGGASVDILEQTWQLSDKVDEQSRCSFTVLDPTGNASFSKGQPVVLTDSVQGVLYKGYVNKPKAVKMPPNAHRMWSIDCIDNVYLAMKRTSNKAYINQYAGTIVADQINSILSQEGITGAYAIDFDSTTAEWGDGTLTNVVPTSNVDDGDLELALAGTPVTQVVSTTTNWNTNLSLSNLDTTGNQLQLASVSVLRMTGNCGNNFGNAVVHQKIWSGSYTIVTGDQLTYAVWIDSDSPQIMSGIDGTCSDGTTIRDTTSIVDQNGLRAHPNTDLSSFANDQWYSRTIDISTLHGKTLSFVNAEFEGDNGGAYTSYFRDILITNGGSTSLTIYQGTGPHASIVAPAQNSTVKSNGYSNIVLTPVIAYEQSGTRIANTTALDAAAIAKSSFISWVQTQPTDTAIAMSTSIDGNATWQPATLYGAIANLMPGASLTSRTMQARQVLSLTGKDPTVTPVITNYTWAVYPSYVATKSDTKQTWNSQSDWNAGTKTNITATSGGDLQITANLRNWNDASLANQTLYGGTGKAMAIYKGQLQLTVSNIADVRARLDDVGTWGPNFIASIDFQVTTSDAIGLSYLTTGWQDNNDTYAYKVDVRPYQISLSRGTNSSTGTGSRTPLGGSPITLTLTSGDWHTLTVLVSTSGGNTTHTIFLDGVQYISVVDNTWTAAGYFAPVMYNDSGATYSGYFDNFGVMPYQGVIPIPPTSYTLPNWVSQSVSLGSITVGNSVVFWDADVPSGGILNVLASVNGGAYTACTNGGVIPGLTAGTVLTSGTLQLKVQMQSPVASQQINLHGLTAWVSSAYTSTGTRVTPVLSLTPVGRIGSSLINWNAILATNTTLKVETSPDSSTWTDVTSSNGGAIPGYPSQVAPWIDTFGLVGTTYVPRVFGGTLTIPSTSASQYTSTFGSSGSAATWTWDTANKRLIAVGGNKAVLLYNGFTALDVDFFFDMNYSDQGGATWRWQGTSNYYTIVVSDASASSVPNTVKINKVVAGTPTQIGTANISFPRNTYHRFRVTMLGGTTNPVITVYMDGVSIITYTDSTSPFGAGSVGLRNVGNTSQFYQFNVQPLGNDATGANVYNRLTLTSTDPTATPQVQDVTMAVYGPSIGPGVLMPNPSYLLTFVDANLSDLARQSNYWWTIDQNLKVWFQANAATNAPWILDSSNAGTVVAGQSIGDVFVENLTLENSADLYRNRQTVKGAIDTATFTQKFIGDEQATTWNVANPLTKAPTIRLNGQLKTVGVQGVDTGKDFYYQAGSTAITQDSGGTLLVKTDTLTVTYTGDFEVNVTISNTGQFPGTTSIAQMAAIDNSSGIYEAVEDVSGQGMSKAAATTLANQLLVRYGKIGRTLTFKTVRQGLAPGQLLEVFVPEQNVTAGQFLITGIDTTASIVAGGALLYWYNVTATEGPNLGSAWKSLATMIQKKAA